ncbi:unnamed protein product [Arabis nemorensis]|uniref:Uncharacterized protein n=1 Tax=Arabis nemorensis TaxID=586526 RepID=A0A565BLE5_9BRAS|nr:unnamed protein product [Arabis nemorensis]
MSMDSKDEDNLDEAMNSFVVMVKSGYKPHNYGEELGSEFQCHEVNNAFKTHKGFVSRGDFLVREEEKDFFPEAIFFFSKKKCTFSVTSFSRRVYLSRGDFHLLEEEKYVLSDC